MASNPAPAANDRDASRRDIWIYALANLEGGLANQLVPILSVVTVVAFGMSPLLIGLIVSLQTLVMGFCDPVMAQVTDNARTRWGRRIPFIMMGGVGRCVLLLAIFLCFPRDASIKTNAEHKAEQAAHAAAVAAPAAPADAPVDRETVRGAASGEPEPKPADTAEKKAEAPAPDTLWRKISAGFAALTTADNPYHRQLFYYLLAATMIVGLVGTIQSVPYYALGIELAPSYDGRTRVVTTRAYIEKIASLVAPWIVPFAFLPVFTTVYDGLTAYAVLACAIGMPATLALGLKVREPAAWNAGAGRAPSPPLLRSVWLTMRSVHFLKILFLYVFFGFTNGIFTQVGGFLMLYWVFKGDVVAGGVVNGYASTIAVVLGFATLPLIQWASKRLGKHVALRLAIAWLAVGAALKWFLINPHHPYLQLVLPFFFSIGIGSFYTILPSLMADVTDIDELQNGTRREGMFGAVMGFLLKALTSLQPVLAGAVLVLSGFDATKGANQPEEVFHTMRLMASWIPAALMAMGMLVLIRYPLTRSRMEQVKAELLRRRSLQTR